MEIYERYDRITTAITLDESHVDSNILTYQPNQPELHRRYLQAINQLTRKNQQHTTQGGGPRECFYAASLGEAGRENTKKMQENLR